MSEHVDPDCPICGGTCIPPKCDYPGLPEWDRIWTTPNGGFEIWQTNHDDATEPFTLFHHGEWVGDYWYTQQAKRDAVPQDCSKCGDRP